MILRLMALAAGLVYCIPDDGKGGTSGGAADVEVELQGGVKVKLPPDQAAAYAAARSKDKSERESMAARAGAADAAAAAEAAAAKKAKEDAELAKAAAAADIGKVRELATKEANERLAKVSGIAVRDHLQAAATRCLQGIDKSDLSDIVALTQSRVRLNADTALMEYLDEAGQPLQVDGKPVTDADAFINLFASTRPRFKPQKAPPGDGTLGRGEPPKLTGTMSRTDYDKQVTAGTLPRVTLAAINSGALKLTD